ncbi:hypothetical protein U9M48_022388 [Paspalum notatum var. saurae]|uniref:Uncharacterized protein n=1 Tax=Paspalum notatum var. saurae TaxID=547442 RepID=A0AAQ3TIH7_PASNO
MHTPSPTPHLEAQAPALCPISPRASAADVRHRRLRSTTRPRRRGPHAALAPTREPTGPRRHARQQSRTAAADAASTTDVAAEGDQDESNLRSPVIDAKERKRQRDRERYATLSVEKRNEINKKRREARQRNKGWSIMTVSSTADMDTGTQQLHQVETWLLVQARVPPTLLAAYCLHTPSCQEVCARALLKKDHRWLTPKERLIVLLKRQTESLCSFSTENNWFPVFNVLKLQEVRSKKKMPMLTFALFGVRFLLLNDHCNLASFLGCVFDNLGQLNHFILAFLLATKLIQVPAVMF